MNILLQLFFTTHKNRAVKGLTLAWQLTIMDKHTYTKHKLKTKKPQDGPCAPNRNISF